MNTDYRISHREKEILELISFEFTTKEIAEKLYLSQNTITSHRYNLFSKLAVKNVAGLVRKGFEIGILQITP